MDPVVIGACISFVGAICAAVVGALVATRRKAAEVERPPVVPRLVGTEPTAGPPPSPGPIPAPPTPRPPVPTRRRHDPASSLLDTPPLTRTYAEPSGDDLDAAVIHDIQLDAIGGDDVEISRDA